MTAILTRRWFLIGSGAALAFAAAPAVAAPLEPVVQVPSWTPYLHRKIVGIYAWIDNPNISEVLTLSIKKRGEPNPKFRDCFHSYSGYAWVPYERGIYVDKHEILELDILGKSSLGKMQLMCIDKIDDGEPIMLMEHHEFPRRWPPVVLPLYPQSAERLERAKARATA